MTLELKYYPEDKTFSPFNLFIEILSLDTPDYVKHLSENKYEIKLVNKDLAIEVKLESRDNHITIEKKIEKELMNSWKKIVEDYDDSKLIFRSLKKIKKNLEDIKV